MAVLWCNMMLKLCVRCAVGVPFGLNAIVMLAKQNPCLSIQSVWGMHVHSPDPHYKWVCPILELSVTVTVFMMSYITQSLTSNCHWCAIWAKYHNSAKRVCCGQIVFILLAFCPRCTSAPLWQRPWWSTVRNICSQISAGVSFGYIEDPNLAISTVV